jgi:hypothetical protein
MHLSSSSGMQALGLMRVALTRLWADAYQDSLDLSNDRMGWAVPCYLLLVKQARMVPQSRAAKEVKVV